MFSLIEYSYNSNNNRTYLTASGEESYTVSYLYNVDNWLITEVETKNGVQKSTSYTYDGNGNQKSKISRVGSANPAETTTSEYDLFNRLVKVTNGEGTSHYAYSPDGTRFSKETGGTKLRQIWDAQNLSMEFSISGSVMQPVRRYLRGINAIYIESGGIKNYYLYNVHSDVVQLTDTLGTVIKEYQYDAFGNERNPISTDTNPLRYCGEYFDTETGMIYLRARYYDPRIGRFTSADTVLQVMRELANGVKAPDLLSLNRYTYCYNNPLMFYDSTGNFASTIIGAVSGAIIGGFSAAARGDNIWAGAVAGGVSGAIAGLAVDIAIATYGAGAPLIASLGIAFVGGAVGAFAGYAINQFFNDRAMTAAGIITSATLGGISNMASFGITSTLNNAFNSNLVGNTLSQQLTSMVTGSSGPEWLASSIFSTWHIGVPLDVISNITIEELEKITKDHEQKIINDRLKYAEDLYFDLNMEILLNRIGTTGTEAIRWSMISNNLSYYYVKFKRDPYNYDDFNPFWTGNFDRVFNVWF